MLRGMDNDYHHLQTRKLKFREMKYLACGCTDIHMPVLLKLSEAVLISEPHSYQEPPAPLLVKYHSIYPPVSIHGVLSASKAQWFITVIWVWHCARVKRSPHLSEIRPSPTTWTVTRVQHLLFGRWEDGGGTSHPPWSREDDISRQSYSGRASSWPDNPFPHLETLMPGATEFELLLV